MTPPACIMIRRDDMKTRTRTRKLLSLLLTLAMVLSMIPTVVATGETATYEEVAISSAADITAGTYLISGTSSRATDDGRSSAFMSTTGSTNTRLMSADLVVTDGTVQTDDADCVWKLIAADGGFYVQNVGNDKYLYYGTKTGNNIYQTADQTEAGIWTVVSNGEGWTLQETASGRQLSCNRFGSTGSYYLGFAAYANTSSTDRILTFYKLSDSSTVDPGPSPSVSPSTEPEPAGPLTAEDKVVIYNPANLKALSATYSGFYNSGTDVTVSDGTVSGYTAADVWTVGVDGDGNYTFSTADGKKLSMGESYTSTPLDDVNTGWKVTASVTEGCYYIQNAVRGNYLEWYADQGNWSSYSTISDEALFAQAFYKVPGETPDPDPGPSPNPSPDPDPDEPEGTRAVLVTDVSGLVIGDEYIIACPTKNMVMAPSAGNFFGNVEATFTDDVVYFGDGAQTVFLAEGTTAGTYAFEVGGNYLCSVDSENYLKTTSAVNANSSWSVVFDGATAAVTAQAGASTQMKYNSGAPRFSCYKSGQTDISIYKVERPQYAELNNAIADGDQFVVFYDKGSLVVSSTATSDGKKLEGVSATPENNFLEVVEGMAVFTARADGDNFLLVADGKYLTSGATGNSLTFTDEASDYSLWTIKPVTGGVHIVNANAAYNGNPQALEYYSGFTTFSEKDTDYYLFNLYKLTRSQPPESDLPARGAQVMIYNLSSKGVLAFQDDNETSPSITNAAAELADGKVTSGNGGLVFTVEKNDSYYRFRNETYGYLCSNGTGNNAFYSPEASEDADWTLAAQGSGYTMESRTAKYNGKYSQYMEYYAGSYKTYSMYNVTDYDIYTFQFLPCANENLTGGVVNQPAVDFGTPADAFVGSDYTLTFTVDAVFGVKELTVKLGKEAVEATLTDGVYSVTIPSGKVTGESLTISVDGKDNRDVAISGSVVINIKDEPVISDVAPAPGSETGDNKRPVISAAITNAGDAPTIVMTVNGETVETVCENGVVSYTPAVDMADGRVSVTITVTRADGKSASKSWNFTVGEAQFQLYFGQLHSHTQYSDGSGTLDSALEYIKNLPESANVDFAAFTDHSNYFDKSGDANPEDALYDMSKATAYSQGVWAEYKGKIDAFNASQSGVVALGGFEMTWSGGPGHINTWNTPGIVSRNNSTLNNKTSDAGMKAYYALLSRSEGADSISQFNHPGSTFGTFSDFAYWDATIDSRMYMVEVGNGEGAIGAGGYYPSYEYYTMALDKGWHLAPTNNQDNHKGKWGNANDARDVILTDNFSEEGLYEAIRNYRVYATEDKNLAITYTVNGQMLGSQLPKDVEALELAVTVNDPDSSDSIAKVEVIVNSGKVAYTWSDAAELASGELSATLEPTYSYYYIRVTEKDGDLAVTAPVWVGEVQKLGISSVECGTSTPVTNEELTLTTTLFNSETTGAMVKSITYSAGNEVLGTADLTGKEMIAASSTLAVDFKYTPTVAKVMTITVTAVVEQNGVEYTYTKDIELDVLNADSLVYIGIDASHYNEYVAGNYKDSMGNFGELAAGYSVRTVELKTSDELIAACSNPKYKALILTAPSRRLAAAQSHPKTYSADELAAITAFNANGGVVILAGWSDNYENYSVIQDNKDILHMAATQNAVLEALGSSLRISDDATYDDVRSAADGVDKWRLYFSAYGDSFLTDGVIFDAEHPFDKLYTERFSHYGGASVYAVDADGASTSTLPGTVIPVVYGHESTYSVDVDKDGLGGDAIPKYAYADSTNRLMVMASEQLEGKGLIIVSGAAFMSNFEVQSTVDNGAEKNYSNYRICENLVQYINPITVTDIAEVQKQTEAGYKYTIEGVVTSNASGYDKDTAFFDCIYIQDETGGICCFPVSGDYKIGDKVRITGTTDFYQGEMELQVTSINKIGETDPVEPKEVTAAQINDRSVLGQLVTLKGTVVSYELANGLVQTIMVKDAAGNVARVFIDGYITTGSEVQDLKVGCNISVIGLASYDDTFNSPEGPFPRIRIRNRADIVCTAGSGSDSSDSSSSKPQTKLPFTDVFKDDWFEKAVRYVYTAKLFQGTSATTFEPDGTMTRSMMAEVLYRLSGEQYTGSEVSFLDTVSGSWYSTGVSWGTSKSLIQGYGNGTFGVEDPVTREQMAAILYRYAQYKGLDVSVGEDTNILSYTDAGQVSEWAIPAVQWAVGAGLMQGNDNGSLNPQGYATRAEVAALLMQYAKLG